jgi:hypothetical protein
MEPQPTAERMHPYVWPGAPPAHNCMIKFLKITQKSQIKMQIWTIKNPNFEQPFSNPSNRTQVNILKKIFLDISPKKFGSAYAQRHRENVRTSKFPQKSKEKKQNFFSKIYQGHIRL